MSAEDAREMTPYDRAVSSWARKFLGGDRSRKIVGDNFVDDGPMLDRIDWSRPCQLIFDYEEPYQYSEYTGGGGTGQIDVWYPLIRGGFHTKTYADLTDLNKSTALPLLIQAILGEAQ